MKILKAVLGFCILFSGAGGLAYGAPASSLAPPLEARLLDGKTFSLAAEIGHVVLIHYWATWCGECREELPGLVAFYKEHEQQGLRIIAISKDEPEDIDKVRATAKTLPFPVAMEADVKAPGYGRMWGMPATLAVDRHGMMRVGQAGCSLAMSLITANDCGTRVFTVPDLEAAVSPLLAAP